MLKLRKNDWGTTLTVVFVEDSAELDLSTLSLTAKKIFVRSPYGITTEITAAFRNPPGDGSDGAIVGTIASGTLKDSGKGWTFCGEISSGTGSWRSAPEEFEVVTSP
jgi:hypothetical protein